MLKPKPNLSAPIAQALREAIGQGQFGIGQKLPSEATLTAQHGVSRPVVREAIAELRADGMVEARQGAGVFVIRQQPIGSALFEGIDSEKLSSILEILELRTAVEVEAASLAAQRRSPVQEDAIFSALKAFEEAAAAQVSTVESDLAFHLAIANATNNPRFSQFLNMFGRDAIPRDRLAAPGKEFIAGGYLTQIQSEHRQIAEAIAARDAAAAGTAMRAHLQGSQQRYRRMLHRPA